MTSDHKIEAYLMDMDGVLVHQEQLVPGADQFVRRLQETGHPFLVLTNNSIYTQRDLAARLSLTGLQIPEEAIWTSALATAHFLDQQRPGGTAHVIGEAGLTTALHERGYVLSEREPDYVVLGETRSYSQESITRAIRLIEGGARFIATNPDPTGPSPTWWPPSTSRRGRPAGSRPNGGPPSRGRWAGWLARTGSAIANARAPGCWGPQGAGEAAAQGRAAASSPEPRGTSRVGTTRWRGGLRSPSSRANSSSAAVRPRVAGSWAITETRGSSRSASRTSSKPTRATRCCSPSRCSARMAPMVIRFWPVNSAVGASVVDSSSSVARSAASMPWTSWPTTRGSSWMPAAARPSR